MSTLIEIYKFVWIMYLLQQLAEAKKKYDEAVVFLGQDKGTTYAKNN